MDEVKFRVYDRTTDEMYQVGDETQLVFGGGVQYKKWSLWTEEGMICDCDDAELIRFSTLKDMDGKDIYEDDIIFIFDDVETESGWWENIIFHRGAFMAGDENLLVNVNFRSRVVGNKYSGTNLR